MNVKRYQVEPLLIQIVHDIDTLRLIRRVITRDSICILVMIKGINMIICRIRHENIFYIIDN